MSSTHRAPLFAFVALAIAAAFILVHDLSGTALIGGSHSPTRDGATSAIPPGHVADERPAPASTSPSSDPAAGAPAGPGDASPTGASASASDEQDPDPTVGPTSAGAVSSAAAVRGGSEDPVPPLAAPEQPADLSFAELWELPPSASPSEDPSAEPSSEGPDDGSAPEQPTGSPSPEPSGDPTPQGDPEEGPSTPADGAVAPTAEATP